MGLIPVLFRDHRLPRRQIYRRQNIERFISPILLIVSYTINLHRCRNPLRVQHKPDIIFTFQKRLIFAPVKEPSVICPKDDTRPPCFFHTYGTVQHKNAYGISRHGIFRRPDPLRAFPGFHPRIHKPRLKPGSSNRLSPIPVPRLYRNLIPAFRLQFPPRISYADAVVCLQFTTVPVESSVHICPVLCGYQDISVLPPRIAVYTRANLTACAAPHHDSHFPLLHIFFRSPEFPGKYRFLLIQSQRLFDFVCPDIHQLKLSFIILFFNCAFCSHTISFRRFRSFCFTFNSPEGSTFPPGTFTTLYYALYGTAPSY